MAKLSQLTEGFMQSFLRNNPKSLVDSNGYLRSEYEEELARRAQPVTEQPTGVPDPRTWRPQFECTGEVAPPAFESPDTQLGIEAPSFLDATWPEVLEKFDSRALSPLPVNVEIAAKPIVDSTGWKADEPLIVPAEPLHLKLRLDDHE